MARKGDRSLQDPRTLRRFVRRLREGIYITSEAGQVLDANPALLDILGFDTLDELRGASAEELYADPEQRRRELELLERDGEVREFELELRRSDGERRTVLDTCYRVHGEDGDLFHGVLVDITPRKRLEAALREQSRRDALTGCYNRHFLEEFAAVHERRRARWGAVIVDVDHFKSYNDRFGHAAGDAVLSATAQFLERSTRAEDPVVRIGGDEFLVLVVGRAAARTTQVAERIRTAHDLPVRVSVGEAVRSDFESLERTIARADARLLKRRARERRHPSGGSRVARGRGTLGP